VEKKSGGNAMTSAHTKTRYPRLLALSIAQEIIEHLDPACERIIIAGSLRRVKQFVGDIEILYVPRMTTIPSPTDFFNTVAVNLADHQIARLEKAGILERRTNTLGRETFGPLNKLMRHVQSGIAVDLFATEEASWFNYLVCRTGPRELNERICNAAIRKGWHWMPYSGGFRRGAVIQHMPSEENVFKFVGLEYREPRDRI
jgi:DNA polymerase/3'-5' exonuclease PolX